MRYLSSCTKESWTVYTQVLLITQDAHVSGFCENDFAVTVCKRVNFQLFNDLGTYMLPRTLLYN